jgi:hypothetical protein
MHRLARQGIRRQLGQVSWLPPALPEGLIAEPGDHPHDIHRGGIEQLLEVCACQPKVPTLAQVKAPDALREAALNTCPQGVLGFECGGFLSLAGGLDGLMVSLRPDGELPRGVFRRGARTTGRTRATGRSVKPANRMRTTGSPETSCPGRQWTLV